MVTGHEFKRGYHASLFLRHDLESYILMIDCEDENTEIPLMVADTIECFLFLVSNRIHLSIAEIKSLRNYLRMNM